MAESKGRLHAVHGLEVNFISVPHDLYGMQKKNQLAQHLSETLFLCNYITHMPARARTHTHTGSRNPYTCTHIAGSGMHTHTHTQAGLGTHTHTMYPYTHTPAQECERLTSCKHWRDRDENSLIICGSGGPPRRQSCCWTVCSDRSQSCLCRPDGKHRRPSSETWERSVGGKKRKKRGTNGKCSNPNLTVKRAANWKC